MSALTITIDTTDPKAAQLLKRIVTVLEEEAGEVPIVDRRKVRPSARRQVVVPPTPEELPKGNLASLDDHRLVEAMGRHGMRRG